MGSQFVVQVDDRPGALSRLFHLLALRGINLHHVAGVSSGVIGQVVLTLSDDDAAREVLGNEGYTFSEGDPLVLRVRDEPGALAEITDTLARAGVNISSVLEIGRHGGWVDNAFTVDDLGKAGAAVAGSDVAQVGWRAGSRRP